MQGQRRGTRRVHYVPNKLAQREQNPRSATAQIGHVKDELFLPIYEMWAVRGSVQLAAGVLVSVKMCIYGQTNHNEGDRREGDGDCLALYR